MRVAPGSSQQRASWDVWGGILGRLGGILGRLGALGERYVQGGDVWWGRCDDYDDRNGHHVGPLGAKWLKAVVLLS